MYTKDNIIGLHVRHKEPHIEYIVVGIEDNRIVTTNSKGENRQKWGNHGVVENVDRWIETGVWIVKKEPEFINSYQIF